ncbi:TPA: LPXTG cell wall anchor domain-containing protein, partial [Streptococcus suis]
NGHVIENEIPRPDYEDTPETVTGTPYKTNEGPDEKPTEITYNGKVYEYVRVEGVEEGTVTSGQTVVTYIYKEKLTPPSPEEPKPEEPKGRITVKYRIQDENGHVIENEIPRPDYEDTPETVTGTPYKTNEGPAEKPTEITYNGKVYEYVRVEGVEEGTVTSGLTVVTYIYKEKPTPPSPEEPTPPTPGEPTPPSPGEPTTPTPEEPTPPTPGEPTPPSPGEPTPPTPGEPTPPSPCEPTPPAPPTVTPKVGTSQLPNTGEASTSPLYGVLSLVTGLAGLFGLVKKKKEEDQ